MIQNKNSELIAQSIWRSGFIKDKNKIRRKAKEDMRRLIALDLSSSLSKDNPNFNREEFLKMCQLEY